MKLQKQLSRKVGNKEYPKWVITIPPKQIKVLGWNEGDYLESEVSDQKLLVRKEDSEKSTKKEQSSRKSLENKKD